MGVELAALGFKAYGKQQSKDPRMSRFRRPGLHHCLCT